MATVNLTVEVPDEEVAAFRHELVELCFDYGLPVDTEDEFEDETDPSMVIDLPPAHSPEEERSLREFLERLVLVVVI